MANIEINLTLEGEEALRVLQAILNKGAEVSVTQTPVVEETTKPETQEEVAPKTGHGGPKGKSIIFLAWSKTIMQNTA